MKRATKLGVYTYNNEDINFNYYTSIRATDKIKFVKFIVDTLIDDNDYHSEIRDLIFDFAIIHILTDVDVSYIVESDNSVNMIEDFLDETNIVEIIKANASDLIDELNKVVNDKIEYRTGIHRNPISESLSHLLNTIDKKVAAVDTDSMMQMAKVISSMSGELTADKMLEAYSKSDLFKNKYADMMTDREKHNVEIAEVGSTIKNVRSRKKTTAK